MFSPLILPFRPAPPSASGGRDGLRHTSLSNPQLATTGRHQWTGAYNGLAITEEGAVAMTSEDSDKENTSSGLGPHQPPVDCVKQSAVQPVSAHTRSARSVSNLHDGGFCPVPRQNDDRTWRHASANAIDSAKPTHWFRDSSASKLSPDSDQFLAMIHENLKLGNDTPPAKALPRPRSTSSDYTNNNADFPPILSPVSTMRINRLSFSDLSRFGRGNDRLSPLQTSSTESQTRQADSCDEKQHEVLDEATNAISGWQGEPRPSSKTAYNRYELADSTEVLPCDSASQRGDSPGVEYAPTRGRVCRSRFEESTECYDEDLEGQYDGTTETQRRRIRNAGCGSAPPPLTGPKKRSASHFSLRSLTRSLSKRRRRLQGLRKLAAHVYRGSTRRIEQAYQRMRLQKERERRQFEAWRASRRRERPADPLKGKPERGFGAFSLERGRYGNEEWWKEGVAKYKAPSWMVFSSGR